MGFLFPLMLPATEDAIKSIARFVMVPFPVYVVLARFLKSKWLFGPAIVGSAAAMCGLLARFVRNHFVA
jgi:hypothetical protein